MKKARNILLLEIYSSIIISLVAVVLFEAEILIPGGLADDKNLEFMILSIMEIATLCLIPLALRLFKFNHIGKQLTDGNGNGLLKWGSLRMMMLCLPMIANTILYYEFMAVAFGYMAIIGLICLMFIYPSSGRCANEMGGAE